MRLFRTAHRLDAEEKNIAKWKDQVVEFKSNQPSSVKKAKRLLNGIGVIFAASDLAVDTAPGQFGPNLSPALNALDTVTQMTGTLEATADETVSQFGDKVASKIAKR